MSEKGFNFTDSIATLAVSALCTPFAIWILDSICYHKLYLNQESRLQATLLLSLGIIIVIARSIYLKRSSKC